MVLLMDGCVSSSINIGLEQNIDNWSFESGEREGHDIQVRQFGRREEWMHAICVWGAPFCEVWHERGVARKKSKRRKADLYSSVNSVEAAIMVARIRSGRIRHVYNGMSFFGKRWIQQEYKLRCSIYVLENWENARRGRIRVYLPVDFGGEEQHMSGQIVRFVMRNGKVYVRQTWEVLANNSCTLVVSGYSSWRAQERPAHMKCDIDFQIPANKST